MHCNNLYNNNPVKSFFSNLYSTYPMVVIKLVVKEPSENRRRRQLFPTPIRGFFFKKKKVRCIIRHMISPTGYSMFTTSTIASP